MSVFDSGEGCTLSFGSDNVILTAKRHSTYSMKHMGKNRSKLKETSAASDSLCHGSTATGGSKDNTIDQNPDNVTTINATAPEQKYITGMPSKMFIATRGTRGSRQLVMWPSICSNAKDDGKKESKGIEGPYGPSDDGKFVCAPVYLIFAHPPSHGDMIPACMAAPHKNESALYGCERNCDPVEEPPPTKNPLYLIEEEPTGMEE